MTDDLRVKQKRKSKKLAPPKKVFKKSQLPVGRPLVMTDQVLKILKDAFLEGMNDLQACNIAGISTMTLYNYQTKNPDFIELKKVLRSSPAIKARRNINKELELGNIDISVWYAERKMKDEFMEKTSVEITPIDKVPTQELLDMAKEAIKKLEEENT